MRCSFQTRIFLCLLAVTLTALSLPLLHVRASLHRELLADARQQALRDVRLAALALESGGAAAGRFFADGDALGLRLTLLDAGGAVLRDSALDADRAGGLDNHGDRPEVREALAGGEGFALRRSTTLDSDLIYVAVRLENGGVLRLAVPFAGLEHRVRDSYRAFLLVALGAVVCSLLLSWLLSWRLRRPLDAMVAVVRDISLGKYDRRLHSVPGREFAALAEAVNRMAGNIERQIRIMTDQAEQLKGILNTMTDGVLLLGPRGRIRRYNRALAVLFPAVTGTRGAPVVEVIPSAPLQEAVDALLEASARREPPRSAPPPERRLHLEFPGGRVLEAHLSCPATPTPQIGAVAVFHDITELVRLEKVRRDFVANVSHELRTPLTAIQGYAETLSRLEELPEDCRRFAEIIHRHGGCLARMVEELLTLARLEDNGVAPALTPLDPREALEAARELCQDRLTEKSLRLTADLPEDLRVLGNDALLTRMFRNLLENACRYAPEGSEIGVRAAVRDGQGIFRVTDQGPGIPPEHLERIFERFYRVEQHRGTASTGLGLAICKHMAERQGGWITAESPARDAATALIFSLPLATNGDVTHAR